MKREKFRLKETFKLAGKPGFLLIGYYIIQFAFARQRSNMGAVDASAAVFAMYALGCGLYSFRMLSKGVSKRFLDWAFLKSPIKWFGLYTLLCFASSLWSSNVMLSAYRAVECTGFLLLNMAVICTLIHRCTFRQVMLWSVTYAFLNILLTFGVGLLGLGVNYALYASQFPSTIFFYLAFYIAPTKYIKYPMMAIAFLCKSVTGYAGMALGMCSLMFGNKKYRALGLVLGLGIIIAVSTMGVDDFLNQTLFASKGGAMVDGQLDEGKTSGRTRIWGETEEIMQSNGKQWTGFGFVVGEMTIARVLIGEQVIGMHNGFLSAYVGTGYIGLFLFSIFILSVVILALKNHIPKEFRAVLIACICVILFHTYGNPGLGFRVYGTWMPAMFIIMLMVGMEYKSKYLNQKH